ncbi:DJ-1/PfpI family protein [Kitasatospora atroaurantiaca]|uniref:DJ-1/PfpI family protein n=1 Tax=Kitasatospora atroaurantiaca TaxID=285545 RepID=UPI0031DB6A45
MPTSLDLLVVPGFELLPTQDLDARMGALGREVDVIGQLAGRGVPIASICLGAFLLGEAGLLDGRRATTAWLFARALAARYPQATVDEKALIIRPPVPPRLSANQRPPGVCGGEVDVRRSRSSTRTVRCRSTGICPTRSGRCCGRSAIHVHAVHVPRHRPVVPGVLTPALGRVIRPRRPRPPSAAGRPAGT